MTNKKFESYSLDKALTKMKGGETVSAMLKPEQENDFDRKAIAVHLDYGNLFN